MKKWIYRSPSADTVNEISAGLNISKTCATVLVNRGFTSIEAAKDFLNPDIAGLGNPFLLPDIEKAVQRIKSAVDKKEKILIYGDRDVDGVSSVCIMIKTLKSLGADALWYVPANEGYGLNNEVISSYKEQNIGLIITVDCGITAVLEIEHAKSLGIDVIVTDHHEPSGETMPNAYAVIDPKIRGSKYPFTQLAGCAVAFKVCEALMLSFGRYYNTELVLINVCTNENSQDLEDVRTLSLMKFKNSTVVEELKFDLGAQKFGEDSFENLLSFIGSNKLIFKNARDPEVLRSFAGKLNKKFDPGQFIDLVKIKDEASVILENGCTSDEVLISFLSLEDRKDLRMMFFRKENFDIVALGTIADIMPLKGENRILVKEGLKYLNETKNPGIQVLLERCSRSQNALNAKAISWNVTPMLNAAGRCGKADLSAKLLLSKDIYEANKLFDEIFKLNEQRKKLQAKNIDKFSALVKEQCDLKKDKILVITATGLEHGVTGIVASHIVRQYSRPVILFILQDKEAVGAVRSVEGVDIIKLLGRLGDILIKYGGHTKAAGLTISAEKLAEFKERIQKIASEEISEELLAPKIELDAELDAGEVDLKLIKELGELEPFGCENPQPIFSLRNMEIIEKNILGAGGNHIKLSVKKNGSSVLKVLGWGMGNMEFKTHDIVDIAVSLELEVYNGVRSPRLVIEDIKESVKLEV